MTSTVRLRALTTAILGAALLVPAAIEPATTVAITTGQGVGACSNGWQELFIPDGSFNDIPQGAVTRSGRLEWVVGGGHRGPMTLKWNGEKLVAKRSGSSLRRGLADGVPRKVGSALVGGYTRPSRGAEIAPLVGRIDGNVFRRETALIDGGVNAALADVVTLPKGRGYAVGTYLDRGQWKALVLRRDGGQWVRRDPFRSGGSGLLGVDKAPGGTVWAAGWRVREGQLRPLVLKRVGSGWRGIGSASLPGGSAMFTDISIPRSGQGWAIGFLTRGDGAKHTPFLQSWKGKAWRRVALPWDGTSAIPQSLFAGAGGDLWIAGTQLATANRETRGFVAHRSGGSWTMRYIDTPPDVRSSLQSVDATRKGAVVTGTIAATALVLRTCDMPPGVAATGRRIAVSGIGKRRRAKELHGAEAGMPTFAAAGAVELAAPVAPSGFVMRDRASAAGLAQTTRTYGALVADFDGNGWKDVFISRHQGMPRLMLNDGGTFSDGPTTAFSPVDRHGCDVGDIDANGWKDIICVTGRRFGTSVNHHEVSWDVAGPSARFDRRAGGIADPLGRGRSVALIRLDGDRFPEAFVGDQPEREDVYPSTNRFYRNVAGTFRSAPGRGLDRPIGAHCAKATDVDRDGDQDLLVCARFPADGGRPGLRIYRNESGRLRDRTASLGIKPAGDIDVTMADVTGDGKRDLIQLAGNRLRVSQRTASGFRRIYELRTDKAVAVAAGDVNGDKRADIFIARGGQGSNAPDRLLVNKGRGKGFTSVRIPQVGTRKGRGDGVVALDYDKNGLTDFLVLNGRGKAAGPVQLLAAFRDPS